MFSTPKCQTLYISNKCHQSGQNLTERRTRSWPVAVIADRLKKLIRPTAWFLFLTLFIVIAASRPVNKNVNKGAVKRAKCGTSRAFRNYWRTIKPLLQLLSLYTDPKSQSAERYRQTDRIRDDVNSRSDCVAVRSAKKYHFKMKNVALVLSAGYFL